MKHIEPLVNYLKKIDVFRQISSVISWDQETMMPSGSIDARAKQCSELAGVIHEQWVSLKCRALMAACVDIESGEPDESLSVQEVAFMREVYPIWKRHNQLPTDFVEQMSRVSSIAQHEWQKARQANDFGMFSPHLNKIVSLQKEKTQRLGFNDHPYNCLLEEYEPGMTVQKLDALFQELKPKIIDFIKRHKVDQIDVLSGNFDISKQLDYSKALMNLLGFNTEQGRLDVSVHPFTIDIHPTDVRITTRVSPNFLEAFSSTVHEIGHGLYEQGLDQSWVGTPFGSARSMAVHESQSRFWEIFICQSQPFWDGQMDDLKQLFPDFKSYEPKDLYRITHQVCPHWCRVESDVVSYNLHIMLRYECEKDLISGELSVEKLPEIWNEKMKEYLDIDVESDAKGCLQDVHWAAGLFGYFPSYTLGTMIAEKLVFRLRQDFPELENMIRQSEFKPIKEWLNKHIHSQGCQLTTEKLLSSLSLTYDVDHFMTTINNQWC